MLQDRKPRFQGVNCYVPKMQYAAGVSTSHPQTYNLGRPIAAGATVISANAGAANGANGTVYNVSYVADSTYGRGVQVNLSGVPGNAPVFDVYGEDYLGQPMVERFTGSAAVTTTSPAAGLKMFYRVLRVRIVTTATNAVNIQVGTTTRLGLPYKGYIVWAKEGAPPAPFIAQANIDGNHIKPVLTDPATVATGEPKGSYEPDAAPAGASAPGTNEYIVGLVGDPSFNSSNNGGLHGIRHFIG